MRYPMIGVLLVAGCSAAPTISPQVDAPAGPDTCDAAAYQALLGQPADAANSVPEPKRSYRLGDPVTMDFVPERLNIKRNDAGTIIAITCG